MASSVKMTVIGNSAGVILAKETLAHMNVGKGDELFVVETAHGIELTPCQPDFDARIEVAKRMMRENRDDLRTLAE